MTTPVHLLTLRLGTKALETVMSRCLGCVCVDVLCCIRNAVIKGGCDVSCTAGWLQEVACFGRLHHHGLRHGGGLAHGHWKREERRGFFSYCILVVDACQTKKLWLLQMMKKITRHKPHVHSGSISQYCVRCICKKATTVSQTVLYVHLLT